MKKLLGLAKSVKRPPPPSHALVYPPLRGEQAIRLVELLPGSGQGDIKCSLKSVSLDSEPEYFALSYRWGDANNKTWISCNSQRCDITQDLWVALKRFRRSDMVVTFWIDQLCINQADLDERAEQVRMMQKIYSSAECVYIWLGPEGNDSKLALQVLPWLSGVVRKYEDLHSTSCVDWNQSLMPEMRVRNDKEWKALSDLLRRPWFSRAWVVQEVAFAKNAMVVCGKDEQSWQEFAYGISRIIKLAMNATGAMPITHWRLIYMANIIQTFEKDRHLPSEELLPQSRFFEATDKHDNIFAIMGLAPRVTITELDYSKDVADVYTDVARRILFGSQGQRAAGSASIADLLSRSQGPSQLNIPSWVPDWSRPADQDFEPSREKSNFRAGGKGELKVFATDDPRKIRVRGKIFDSIQAVSSVAPAPSVTDLDKAFSRVGDAVTFYTHLHRERYLLNCWINETSALAWSCSHQTDEASRLAAYSRTLVCNNLARFAMDQLTNDAALDLAYWAFRKCLDIMYPRGVPNGAPLHSIALAVNPQIEAFELYEVGIYSFGVGFRFVMTTGGLMALANTSTQPGDLVCVLEGAKFPWIIRQHGAEYSLIGDCYVHGAMEGEVMETEALQMQNIILR